MREVELAGPGAWPKPSMSRESVRVADTVNHGSGREYPPSLWVLFPPSSSLPTPTFLSFCSLFLFSPPPSPTGLESPALCGLTTGPVSLPFRSDI